MGGGQYPSRMPGPGRLERPACWSVLVSVWQWLGVVVWPWTHYARRQWGIAEILVEDSEVYLEGRLVRMISKRVHMVADVGLYLVGSLIICVRLRASSLDCRMAGVLSMSQFRSPNRTNSENRWGTINSHMMSRAQLGAEEVYNKRQLWETCFWKGVFFFKKKHGKT